MSYDYSVERMPDYKFTAERPEEKHKRIWQVVMIERDDAGAFVRKVHVERANLTHDEAASAWNELVQALRRAERERKDK